MFGYVIEEQSQPSLPIVVSFLRTLRADYPHLAQALVARRRIGATEQFRRGLGLILDGVAVRVSTAGPTRKGSGRGEGRARERPTT